MEKYRQLPKDDNCKGVIYKEISNLNFSYTFEVFSQRLCYFPSKMDNNKTTKKKLFMCFMTDQKSLLDDSQN